MKVSFSAIFAAALFSSLSSAAPTKNAAPTVRVQLNGISGEDAIQREVPADNSPFSLGAARDFFSAQIVDAEGLRQPACQVFSDLKGLVPASEISVTTTETELLLGSRGSVQVGSLRCSHL
ncbi:uncharacterized protein BP5553_06635 [Venustampulla echinocandica]|uniref:Uncharacterized protein n=1 Tax=Venustampulla echinocandica TaxID=2656787 RepID=A0A370TKH5_9HELO|nr:uncharacterized protein BP5553_06635 [Venustampulla echinocandica]RDL36023.1 hypothetical protein BP5553_06635 [Venustampulla echinocandica]